MKPQPMSAMDANFPADTFALMPKWNDIPEAFRREKPEAEPWLSFQRDWFYGGLRGLEAKPRDGIDATVALRHLHAIQGSFEPKHEHKAAAVAYLASLWFESVSYTRAKP